MYSKSKKKYIYVQHNTNKNIVQKYCTKILSHEMVLANDKSVSDRIPNTIIHTTNASNTINKDGIFQLPRHSGLDQPILTHNEYSSISGTRTDINSTKTNSNSFYESVPNQNRQNISLLAEIVSPNNAITIPKLTSSEKNSNKPTSNDNFISQHPYKRRVVKACYNCRRRKIKCDAIDPSKNKCSNCLKLNKICSFSENDEINTPFNISHNSTNNKKQKSNPPIHSSNIQHSISGIHPDTNLLSERLIVLENSRDNNDLDRNRTNNNNNNNNNSSSSSQQSLLTLKKGFLVNNDSKIELLGNRMDLLDKKFTSAIDRLANLEGLLLQLLQNNKNKEADNGTKNDIVHKKKQYSTVILTVQKLDWIKRKLCPSLTDIEFITPLENMINLSMKTRVISLFKIKQFTEKISASKDEITFELPSKEVSKYILESLNFTLLMSIAHLASADECAYLLDKYYNEGVSNMTYSELLLLNVGICLGSRYTTEINMNEPPPYYFHEQHVDIKDKDLQLIEEQAFLNSMYYYKKLSVSTMSTKSLQGCVLLLRYLEFSVSIELSLNVFYKIHRYAISFGFHKKEFYDKFTPQELVNHLAIWWDCYAQDIYFSYVLARPPLTVDEYSDVLGDPIFEKAIKMVIGDRLNPNIFSINSIHDLLNFSINFFDCIPLFFDYYTLNLIKIEKAILKDNFSMSGVNCFTPQEIFDNALKKIEALNAWEAQLPPLLKLETHKQYLSLIYLQDSAGDPDWHFNIACYRVLKIHFRFLYQKILLALFIRSFIIDNMENFNGKYIDTFQYFRREYETSSLKMLELFQDTDYRDWMRDEVLYHFFTGVFVALMDLVENINTIPKSKKAYIIGLMQTSVKESIRLGLKPRTGNYLKWNMATFIFAFCLEKIIAFNNQNSTDRSDFITPIIDYKDGLNNLFEHSMKECLRLNASLTEQTLYDFEQDISMADLFTPYDKIDNETKIEFAKKIYSGFGTFEKLGKSALLWKYSIAKEHDISTQDPSLFNTTISTSSETIYDTSSRGRLPFDREFFLERLFLKINFSKPLSGGT
ncbi:hypothetical protein TBLA_0E03480 [Henningerozyma blattae CBS 6284]|uniref:Zn(2)-C6 fungal-type domain-containing protein n=1 Tax=Henningerozyma blattae (strain ATCC 34711 / CBS 6284 / DSM 70876 / NBRC 10599 / NRRL Y-10934 / UCD 77-7) TaxID=1071380 RepID=I2H4V1_HENB6|nr:hypothetical protein TBLA_0E03480 [Tetrapisispora blattae CBS 6284]CCH61403.1 hypothetical protein TBLA_0E03480 [Tetrapisispora blattae CBS 6284]